MNDAAGPDPDFPVAQPPVVDSAGWPSANRQANRDEVVEAQLVGPPAASSWGPLVSVVASWLVIIALVCVVLLLHAVRGEETAPPLASSLELMQANWVGKVLVAYREAAGPRAQIEWAQLPLSNQNWAERCALAILRNELDSPAAALRELAAGGIPIPGQPPPTPNQLRIEQLLHRLFTDYAQQQWSAPSLSAEDRETLTAQLGWFGRLALHPRTGPDPVARQAVLNSCLIALAATLCAMVLGLGVLICGLVGGALAFAAMLAGRIRPRFVPRFRHAHIYVETFAFWLFLFLLFSTVAAAFDWGRYKLLVAGVAFSASLLALVWPVARGIPWAEVRQEIGWTRGAGIGREVFAGVLGYICCVPILLAGLFLLFLAASFAGLGCLPSPLAWSSDKVPTHPLGGELLRGDPVVMFAAYLVACLAAPLIEETFFRGVLYRHLREMSAGAARGVSVLAAAGLNAFVFAIIHPQGVLAVPALAALGFNFSLVREWRDSLLGSIAIHALHNATLITAFVFIFTW